MPDRAFLMKPCRLWHGARTKHGNYGVIRVAGEKVRVHRFVWELVHGPIASGLCVLHRCDHPPCYEITHLLLGTQAQNMRDMHVKGRAKCDHKNRRRGESHPMAVLTQLQADQIREGAKRGFTYRELADSYQVSRSTIKRVVTGKSW